MKEELDSIILDVQIFFLAVETRFSLYLQGEIPSYHFCDEITDQWIPVLDNIISEYRAWGKKYPDAYSLGSSLEKLQVLEDSKAEFQAIAAEDC